VAERLIDSVWVGLGVSDAERVIVGLKEEVCDSLGVSDGVLVKEGVPVGVSEEEIVLEGV